MNAILRDADSLGVCVELVLFSHESWGEKARLGEGVDENAVAALTRELLPARNVTFQIWNEHDDARVLPLVKLIFGGPKDVTSPYDPILQIQAVWQLGAYTTYHHDMFQTGYGTPAVPPSGVPDPEFSPYHRQVFEFLKRRDKYMPR